MGIIRNRFKTRLYAYAYQGICISSDLLRVLFTLNMCARRARSYIHRTRRCRSYMRRKRAREGEKEAEDLLCTQRAGETLHVRVYVPAEEVRVVRRAGEREHAEAPVVGPQRERRVLLSRVRRGARGARQREHVDCTPRTGLIAVARERRKLGERWERTAVWPARIHHEAGVAVGPARAQLHVEHRPADVACWLGAPQCELSANSVVHADVALYKQKIYNSEIEWHWIMYHLSKK